MSARATRSEGQFAATLSVEARAIITEELRILKHLREYLAGHVPTWRDINYDEALLELRDELGEAHEDEVAQIVHQMANLASLSSQQEQSRGGAGTLDPESPYFGHLRVRQGDRERDILIGNRTLASSELPYALIDWRHAPISRVFYLYREGDEYEEEFGGKPVEGRILAHRKVMILRGRLVRIDCGLGVFALGEGRWQEVPRVRPAMGGGAGAALRPGSLERVGAPGALLGVEHTDVQRTDKRLEAITGLIDPAQFELITRPDSGVVVIDGGAGSGKTTIALHRLAYLAYRDPARFEPQRMLAVVFGRALAAYVAKLLPALGVEGVRIEVFEEFVADLRRRHFPGLVTEYDEATPATVLRFKQHPATLRYLEQRVAERTAELGLGLGEAAAGTPSAARVAAAWEAWADLPLAQRLRRVADWVRGKVPASGVGRFGDDWLGRQRLVAYLDERSPELQAPHLLAQSLWEEAFLDVRRLRAAMERLAPGEFSPGQLEEVRNWALRTYSELEDYRAWQGQRGEAEPPEEGEDGPADGNPATVAPARVDREDDTLLLLLHALAVGPVRSRRKRALRFQHLMVDEAQDFSPLDLHVLLGLAAEPRSVTLAGDTDQRMVIHNAFTRWEDVVAALGLQSTAIAPLQVGYRSTGHIMDFARSVLGPLATERPWLATRPGVPVELLRFTDAGQAVAVLSEELLSLLRREPSASVALVARFAEQADLYYEGLERADLPGLRRVAEQDFSFAPGIEVTDVAQVKGLEFDYVILLEVDQATYPDDPASRYLLHIGATRAAHQVLLVACRTPSPLLPAGLPVHLL